MLGSFPKSGEVIGSRYMIERMIGKGGFSCVFRGTQLSLDRPVAIKIMMSPEQVDNIEHTEMEGRFRREAMLVAKLRNPHTITLYDFGVTSSGFLFMVFEFVEGRDLSDIVELEGPQSEERTCQVLAATLSSLYEAHSYGVLHRDIKPGNIMLYDYLDFKDLVKLLDFGIAKPVATDFDAFQQLTATGTMIGTPRYMAPEAIRGATPAPSADIYSLGLVAYEMLTGKKAIPGENHMSIITRQIDPSSVRLPPRFEKQNSALCQIINKMIEKDPSKRYSEVRQVLSDLSQIQSFGCVQGTFSWNLPESKNSASSSFSFPIFSLDHAKPNPTVKFANEGTLSKAHRRRLQLIVAFSFLIAFGLGLAVFAYIYKKNHPKRVDGGGEGVVSPFR